MSRIIDLQNAVVSKIQAIPLVAQPPAVAVQPERLGDMDNRLARQVCSTGILVVVSPAQLYRTSVDPLQRMVIAKTGILIMENVALNRRTSGCKTAPDVAEIIGQALHNWTVPGSFGIGRTMLAECLSLEYGYVTEALWAVPLSQFAWAARESDCPLTYRVRMENEFTW